MTLNCRYHVLEPAEWRCTTCSIDFCGTCSPEPPEEENQQPRKCPHCKSLLQPLGGSHNAPPFWQRLTAFLRYPLSPIAGVLLLLAFAVPLVAPAGPLMHGARLIFLIVFTLYLWAVFESTATGRLEPVGPAPLLKLLGKDSLPLFLGVMLALLAGGTGYLVTRNNFAGSVLAATVVGLLPAFLIGTALTKSVGSGFSKEGLLTALRGIGPVYGAVFLLPILLLGSLLAFVGLFADVLPDAVGQGMDMAAYAYVGIAVFALSGYVLFQYQEELNYTPEGGSGRKRQYRRLDPVQLQVEMLIKDGNYSKAVSLLKMDIDRKSASLPHHERYHKLIWALGQEAELRTHASAYLKQLLQAGRGIQAAGVLRNYLQRYPDFKPAEPEVRLDLAQAFAEQGDFKLAVHVLNGLHKDHAQFPGLPEAYLLAARLLAEKLNMPQKALALVQFLHGRYRNHRSYPEITRLHDELSKQVGMAQEG